ncbi:MAG: bifunctional anthranilate synthase component II/anthranilate phosphoribosyltransferase [Spirochaetaceae bacterium]
MILILDNYDSFTYNLFQTLSEITVEEIYVVRNDRITIEEIGELSPSSIIISPGPGRPEEAGICIEAVHACAGEIPILGVCLGHQAIAQAFGAKIVQAKKIVHGKTEGVNPDGRGLFRSIDPASVFTRYHSLVVEEKTLPPEFEVTSRNGEGEIMGIRHRSLILEGVQFHPESIASDSGRKLLNNFLHYHREPFVPAQYLGRLLAGASLSRSEASNFMEDLTDGNLSPAQIAGFLVALNAKGITPEEIAGCAAVLHRKRVPIESEAPVLDTCGTGGDGLGTFNISSLTALAASACGAVVAKHGNKAVSSKSGSADFYKALDIVVDLPPAYSARMLKENNFAFLFAPIYHRAMKYAAAPRKELGIKTIMNLMGPLVNPAAADYQLIGVYAEEFCEPVAEAAHILGIRRAMVVHGLDGLDELSVSAPSRVVFVDEEGNLENFLIKPEELGIGLHPLSALAGGSAQENAAAAKDILTGGGSAAILDAVILNTAASLKVYGIASTLKEGVERAREAFASGKVAEKLQESVEISSRLAERAEEEAVHGSRT